MSGESSKLSRPTHWTKDSNEASEQDRLVRKIEAIEEDSSLRSLPWSTSNEHYDWMDVHTFDIDVSKM